MKNNIQFNRFYKVFNFISLALVIISVLLIFFKGLNFGVDFKGGTLVIVNFTKPVDINEIRSSMSNVIIDGRMFDFSKAEIKQFGDPENIAIRLATYKDEPEQFPNKIADHLAKLYPDLVPVNKNDFIYSIDKVGPKVGAELKGDAIMAIFSALILILIYISIRFEFRYAVGAIAALAHDVIITLGNILIA